MAIAVQSVSSTAPTGKDSGDYITITKPTGTVDSDLMILHVVLSDPSTGQPTTIIIQDSGGTEDAAWVSLGSQVKDDSVSTSTVRVYYKIASSEGANYRIVNGSGSGLLVGGAIFRIDGHGSPAGIQIGFDIGDSADATPVFTNTIAPTFANSLLLFLASGIGNLASSSASGYAIATDNPSWTEQYDLYGSGDAYFGASDADTGMCAASAVRSQVTDTGDSTLTWSGAHDWSIGVMVVIPPVSNATPIPAVITAVATVQTPTVTGGANVSPAVITATASVQAPTVAISTPDWTNQDKNSSSWVNQDKL